MTHESTCGASPSEGRKLWVDALRALPMLLVIIGHQSTVKTTFSVFASPVKLPLFFAISGYLFTGHRKQVRPFITGLIRRLLIPWLIVCLADALLFIPRNGLGYLPGALRKIALGDTLWYVPCAAIAEVLHRFIRRLCKSPAAVCAASALCFCLGYLLSRLRMPALQLAIQVLVVQVFLLIGALFRRWEPRLSRVPWAVVALMAALYVLMGLVSLRLWPGKALNVRGNRYYNIPYCLAMIWLGCSTLLLAASRVRRFPGVLVFIGQNTLTFYFFHIYGVGLLGRLLAARVPGLPPLISVVVVTGLTCVGCGLLALFINRHCPVIAGRARPKAGRS